MRNYILKAAVVAAQIDSVNGNTVYFTDGSTLDVDNAFITQQTPGLGDYVVDGVKVMSKAKFEGSYCEEVLIDEGEVINQLRGELAAALELLDESTQEIKDLESRLAKYEPPESTAGSDEPLGGNTPVEPEAVEPLGEGVDATPLDGDTPDGSVN